MRTCVQPLALHQADDAELAALPLQDVVHLGQEVVRRLIMIMMMIPTLPPPSGWPDSVSMTLEMIQGKSDFSLRSMNTSRP